MISIALKKSSSNPNFKSIFSPLLSSRRAISRKHTQRYNGDSNFSTRCYSASHKEPHQHRSHSGPASVGPVLNLYFEKVRSGKLCKDPRQEATLAQLDPLSSSILEYERLYLEKGYPRRSTTSNTESDESMWSSFKSKVSFLTNPSSDSETLVAPKGFYMFGDVGSGKTMLMDLFLEATPLKFKQRVHFNSFMLDFHSYLHEWRQTPAAKGQAQSTAIEAIAHSILSKSPLLCFDEFQVTNIADAMILNRLFHTLWEKGAVVIATSNRTPDDLYKGGLQRENFVPFIHELKKRCVIHDIGSTIDYRLTGQRADEIFIVKSKHNITPEEIWNKLTESRQGESMELDLNSRKIIVPHAIKGIAKFNFFDLCDKPLGAADYGLIAREFHTIILTDIPVMKLDDKDLVRRFITLIDELYEHKVKLVCSADADMEALFPHKIDPAQKGASTLIAAEEEMFAFSRTLSRLHEMQTTEYLQSHHVPDPKIRSAV